MKVRDKIIWFIILLGAWGLLFGQSRNPVIRRIETIIQEIRLNSGDVFFSEEFYRYKKRFEELKQKSMERQLTDDELREARRLAEEFNRINEISGRVKPYLTSVLAAREEALANAANDFAPEKYEKAEENLRRLIRRFPEKKPDKIEKEVNALIRMYRKAQFEAIRNKLLSEVRILIQEARDMDAEKLTPRIFTLVNELMKDVENILNKNRFNDPDLQEKAGRLSAESQHLLYLAQWAQRIKRDNSAFEDFALKLEQAISRLAALLNYSPEFSEGIEPVLKDISLSVKQLQNELESLRQENAVLRDSLNILKKELGRQRLELTRQNELKQKVSQLEKEFSREGGKVALRGDEIILRFNGIQFYPGRSEMDEPSRRLLEKIGKVLRDFSRGIFRVKVLQFTDGNPRYNQSLATQRAQAAAFLIQTAGYIPDERVRWEGIVIKNDSRAGSSRALLEIVIELNE